MEHGPGGRGGRRLAGLPAALGVALVGPLGLAAPAQAHTELVSSSPQDGAESGAVPSRVELRFNEAVQQPAYVVVTGPDGATAADGPAAVDGAVVTRSLRAQGAGSYRVAYRAVSADGHPVAGELRFRVVAPPEPSPRPDPSPEEPMTEQREAAGVATDPRAESSWRGSGAVVGWSALGAVAAGAVALAIRRRPR